MPAQVAATLQQAMRLAQAGQLDPAEALLRRLLRTVPREADALQLLGMIARRRGDPAAAVDLFRESLASRAGQPHVLNNLGNCLVDLGRPGEAVAAYREALRLQPGYADARVNLGLALIADRAWRDAAAVLDAAVRANAADARAWAALGQAQRELGAHDAAMTAFRTALRLRPGHVPTLHNFAVLLRLTGAPGEALPILRDCARADPETPQIHYNLGHCLQDLGRLDEAAAAYRRAIALRPTDRDAHDSLSRLLWRRGLRDEYLTSYHQALAARPGVEGLLADLAHWLTAEQRHAEAVALLAPAAGPDAGAELHYRLGQAHWSLGNVAAAFTAFDAARAADPAYAPVLREVARAQIILDRPAAALATIAPRLDADPHDQQALALRGLGWRLTGNARAGWLNDYDRLIGAAPLVPPDGDVAGFNARLEAVLARLHDSIQHPLEQTLRHGTQTVGDLLDSDLPEIATVRAMIDAAVRAYIAALPDDASHPFLGRKAAGFAYAGSWSVRLRRSGHHMNHIHPQGWISSCYYVGLPEAVNRGHQGWLKFGETALHLGEREAPPVLRRPEVGTLFLFPSYFYHGTIPFEDDTHRTTIAFDVVPA